MTEESATAEQEGNECDGIDSSANVDGEIQEQGGENDIDNDGEEETQEENANEDDEEEEAQEKDDEISDNPYERMVKSLTNRASNKRKVKLMENQLAHFVFAESDSDDDEDYTVGDEEMPTDDDDESDGQGKEDGGEESDDSSQDEDKDKPINLLDLLRSYEARGGGRDDSEASHSGDEQQQGEEYGPDEEKDNDERISFDQDTEEEAPSLKGGVRRDDILRSNRQYKKHVLVCGVCLESDENEGDEIVECDNCGITVHEGCYGDFDLDYDNKSVSDDLTEPWFCEPCKSERTTELICELCPTKGGVFKETDTGRWVHLICALYTPYVGFRDVVKLQVVVLEDIKREMWSKKECAFCCDDIFSKTGVCISCDSGLCRTTFHVTCGQRNGFLSDIPDKSEKNDEMSDFLFAHCKLHTMKAKLKKRKTSWMAFQARVSKFKLSDDPDEKARIAVALTQAKLEYKTFRERLIPPKQLPQEFPRLLSSCPEACMLLSRKAELLEMVEQPSYSISNAVVSGKILRHEANLSEDFVKYFFNREMQLKELQQSIDKGEPTLINLQNQQKMLMKKSESYHTKLEELQRQKKDLTQCCQDIHNTLCKLAGRSLKTPNILKLSQVNEKIEQSTELLNSIINRCDTCKSTDNQHLLAHCGTCSRYYHMDCVVPPLSRLPRKSDRYVWQCTSCDPSDKSESDTEGPICIVVKDENGVVRRKRPNKEPEKYNPENPKDKKEKKDESNNKGAKEGEKETTKEKRSYKRKTVNEDDTTVMKKRKRSEKGEKEVIERDHPERNRPERGREKEKNKDPSRSESTEKTKEKGNPPPKKKKFTPSEKVSDCFVCKTMGDPKSLVKCDECGKCYHFLTCIDPPYPRNPKISKYWSWICEECDNSDEQQPIDNPPADDKRVSNKPVPMGSKQEESKSSNTKTPNTEKPSRRSIKKESNEDSHTVKSQITKTCSIKITSSIDKGTTLHEQPKKKTEIADKPGNTSTLNSGTVNELEKASKLEVSVQVVDKSKVVKDSDVAEKTNVASNPAKSLKNETKKTGTSVAKPDNSKLIENSGIKIKAGLLKPSATSTSATEQRKIKGYTEIRTPTELINKSSTELGVETQDKLTKTSQGETLSPTNKASVIGSVVVERNVGSDSDIIDSKPSISTWSDSTPVTNISKEASHNLDKKCDSRVPADDISESVEDQCTADSKSNFSKNEVTPQIENKSAAGQVENELLEKYHDKSKSLIYDKGSIEVLKQVEPVHADNQKSNSVVMDVHVSDQYSSIINEEISTDKQVSSIGKQHSDVPSDKMLTHTDVSTKRVDDPKSHISDGSHMKLVFEDTHMKNAKPVCEKVSTVDKADSLQSKDSVQSTKDMDYSSETNSMLCGQSGQSDKSISTANSSTEKASALNMKNTGNDASINNLATRDDKESKITEKSTTNEHSGKAHHPAETISSGNNKPHGNLTSTCEKYIDKNVDKNYEEKYLSAGTEVGLGHKVNPVENITVDTSLHSGESEQRVGISSNKNTESRSSLENKVISKESMVTELTPSQINETTLKENESVDSKCLAKESISATEKLLPFSDKKITPVSNQDNPSSSKDRKILPLDTTSSKNSLKVTGENIPSGKKSSPVKDGKLESKTKSEAPYPSSDKNIPHDDNPGCKELNVSCGKSNKDPENNTAATELKSSEKSGRINIEKVDVHSGMNAKDLKDSCDKVSVNPKNIETPANKSGEKSKSSDGIIPSTTEYFFSDKDSMINVSKPSSEKSSAITETKLLSPKDNSKTKDYQATSDGHSNKDKTSRHIDISKPDVSKVRHEKPSSSKSASSKPSPSKSSPIKSPSKSDIDKQFHSHDKSPSNKDKHYRHHDHYKSDYSKLKSDHSSPNKEKYKNSKLDAPVVRNEKSSPNKEKDIQSSEDKTSTDVKCDETDLHHKDKNAEFDMEVFGEDY